MIEGEVSRIPSTAKNCSTAPRPSRRPKGTAPLNWETPPARTGRATSPWTLKHCGPRSATTKSTIGVRRTGAKMSPRTRRVSGSTCARLCWMLRRELRPCRHSLWMAVKLAQPLARYASIACVLPHVQWITPHSDAEFGRLIQTIRRKPLQGDAYDASGNLIPVWLDEGALLHLAINPTGMFVGTGEVLAAGEALAHGDPAPLLRLGAEVTPLVSDY